MVTVEIALAFPMVLLLTLVAAWVLHLGQTQARLTDAARATAREAARGADTGTSLAAGHRVVPQAALRVEHDGRQVVVTAVIDVALPGPWSQPLSRTLSASAITAVEAP